MNEISPPSSNSTIMAAVSKSHVLHRKSHVLHRKSHVLQSKSHVLHSKSHVLHSKSHVLHRKSYVLHSKSHVLHRKSHVLHRKSHVLHRKSHVAILEKDRQCTYNVTFRRVRATIAAVKSNNYYATRVCICSLSYPRRNTHAPYCHLCLVRLYDIFPHYVINGMIKKKLLK